MDKFWGLQICPSSVKFTSKVSVYTNKIKWAMSKKKKDHQICSSMTRALLKQNKNKDALKPYKNEKTRMETPKVPLKLHYGSRLPLKSLQKWFENWYQSWVTVKPPKSIGRNAYKWKNHVYHARTQSIGYPTLWPKHVLWAKKTMLCAMEEGKLYNIMIKKW